MKKQETILKRLDDLIPDIDSIAHAYGIDQRRAKRIYASMKILLGLFGELISEQVEYIEGQEVTSRLIERQLGRERDARTILGNIDVFLSGESASIQYILEQVFVPVFAEAFGRLEPERQRALFASLREAVNSLQKQDGILGLP